MESWHKIWSRVLGLVVCSQGNNSHMQYQENAGSIRTLLIDIVLKGYSFTCTNILVYSHFSTLRMLVGPSVWALIHVSLWEGCCVYSERMPFLHTDHRWIHEKFQHSTGFVSHLCFSLAPNAIHQWNINGLCIENKFYLDMLVRQILFYTSLFLRTIVPFQYVDEVYIHLLSVFRGPTFTWCRPAFQQICHLLPQC